MRVTFFSSYLNAHMLSLCRELDALPGVDFTFVAKNRFGGNVGRANLNDAEPYVLRPYDGSAERAEAMRHAVEDDVVVFGHMDGSEEFVEARMERGLLSLRTAERILKRGLAWRFVPPKAKRTYEWFLRYRRQPFYVLCNSAFTAYDLRLSGFPLEKCLMWGYFPEVPKTCLREGSEDDSLTLLWVGRLVGFKRPLDVPALMARLARTDANVRVRMAGGGMLGEALAQKVDRLGVSNCVELLGEVSSDDVDRLMRSSDVLLTTSDRREGWGCALNEGMARGCVPLASSIAGSTPYLVRHGENGFVYRRWDRRELARDVERLAGDRDLVKRLGAAARETMVSTWNASVAAQNLIKVSKALLAGEEPLLVEGPCAPAPLIRDDWHG